MNAWDKEYDLITIDLSFIWNYSYEKNLMNIGVFYGNM